MPTFTNLDSIHRASTGVVAPAAWGDQVNDDMNVLNATLQYANGGALKWDSGAFQQTDKFTFTASSGGYTFAYPVAYSSWSIAVVTLQTTGLAQSVTIGATSATGFVIKAWTGSTQVTSGSITVTYFAIGV